MDIDGVNLVSFEKCDICCITSLSNQLKALLRNELTVICHGKAQSSGLELFSYRNTLARLVNVINKKSDEQKKGLIGELITHLLFKKIRTEFQSASIYLNTEERSAKKGFDLVFTDSQFSSIWYSEVKSGSFSGSGARESSINLLRVAKNDLKKKFNDGRNYIWWTAIANVNNAVSEAGAQEAIKRLLDEEAPIVSERKKGRNIILVSVAYGDELDMSFSSDIEAFIESCTDEDCFDKIMAVSFQKSTYEEIITFLEEEAENA